nr:insulinase family protein [uncultured Undibacterium sp.]
MRAFILLLLGSLRLSAFSLALLLVLPISSSAQSSNSPFAAHKSIPYSSQLIKARLNNGLTYYLQKNAKPEKKAELRLVIKAGSILEDEDQQGLAHFTEHMAFNGSKHFKKNDLVSFLESMGVKFGADLNAYTSFDETVYILPIPTDKPANLDKAIMVLADWAHGLAFDHTEIDRERGIVLEEARLGKGAEDRLNKQVLPKILHGSKYAERLPIGKEDVLKNFQYDALKRFYRDWYRPDLMAVVVVGDIDLAQAKRLIEKNFSALKNPQKPRTRVISQVPIKNINDAVVAIDKEANIATVSISQGRYLNKNDGKFGSYRERRIQSFFNVMLSNRLRELAQLPQPPFLGASSGVKNLVAQYQEFNSLAAIGKAGVQTAIEALMRENKRVAQFGFSAAEFERAKSNALRNMEDAYKEREKSQSAELASEFIRNFLVGEAIPGIEAEYAFHQVIMKQISLDDVNQFARTILVNQEPKLIVYQGNDKPDHVIPDSQQLMEMVKRAEQVAVTAYTEKKTVATLMDAAPQAGSIINEVKDSKLGTTTWTLSNGVTLVMKPSDFKNDQILLGASRAGGMSMVADTDFLQARYATTIVGVMGMKDIAPLELGKFLAGKNVSVSTKFGENFEGISGSSSKRDLETMLQVIYLAMTAPRRDPALFQSFVGKQQDALRNQMASPFAVFQDQLIHTMYPAHPRLPVLSTPEHIAALDLDRLMAIYQARFSSAKGFTFFLVGSFDIEKVKSLVLSYLAGLPAHEVEVGIKDHGLRPVSGIVKKNVYVGKESQSLVTLQMHGERKMSIADRMRFSAIMEVLQLRLTAKMREELGAVYSPQVSYRTILNPYQGYMVELYLPSGPEHVDQLLRSSFTLIEDMKKNPVTEDELKKVKENWLKNRQEQMKTNEFWMAIFNDVKEDNENPMHVFTFNDRVKQLQTREVQDAAKIYLNMDNYIQVVMYPEQMKPN